MKRGPIVWTSMIVLALTVSACGDRPGVASSPTASPKTASESGQWHVESAGQLGQIEAETCATEEFCIVVDRAGYVVSRDGRLTWQRGSFTSSTTLFSAGDVSCPSPTTCLVVGTAGGSVQPSIAVSTDGANSWHLQQFESPGSSLNAISCASKSLCMTAGSAVNTQRKTLIYITRDGGSNWQSVPLDQNIEVHGIACWTQEVCSAVAYAIINGSTALVALLKTADAGTHWMSKTVSTPAGIGSLSCVSTGRCMSVGLSTNDILTTEPLVYIQDATSNAFTRTVTSLGVELLDQVSCGTPLFCIAVGWGWTGSGDNRTHRAMVLATDDGGTTWHHESLPANLTEVLNVSCRATFRCLAGAITDPYGYVVLSRDLS